MTTKYKKYTSELNQILSLHKIWVDSDGRDGTRANLSRANLTEVNLTEVNLTGANLYGANLSGANLYGANLSGANLSGAYLCRADLSGANLSGANLSGANLSGANLSGANLTGTNLTRAVLTGANLTGAVLTGANLSGADLTRANLSGANLTGANLTGATLTGVIGIMSSAEWLRSNMKTNKRGCILAYKAFGNTVYPSPDNWVLKPGNYLTEVVNPDRGTECGCGVNVATLDYINKNHPNCAEIWKIGIEPADIADVVVPFRTDGKFRAARIRLLRRIK